MGGIQTMSQRGSMGVDGDGLRKQKHLTETDRKKKLLNSSSAVSNALVKLTVTILAIPSASLAFLLQFSSPSSPPSPPPSSQPGGGSQNIRPKKKDSSCQHSTRLIKGPNSSAKKPNPIIYLLLLVWRRQRIGPIGYPITQPQTRPVWPRRSGPPQRPRQ